MIKMKYKIYGCRVNKYYLNRWMNYLKSKGIDGEKKYIIATCVVTDRAKTKWLKDLKKHLNEGYFVYLTGCGVIHKGKLMEDNYFYNIYPELIDYKDNIELLGEDSPTPNCDYLLDEGNIYTKKFLVVQNGCDNMCTYCLSVVKRGPSRDMEASNIISQINQFVDNGGKEIVLTGINLAAWGCGNTNHYKNSKFSGLLESILNETKIERIRLSSLGPEFLDEKFFSIVQSSRFMPHFHFSIQSFSDNVLKKMGRNYDSKTLEYVLSSIRNLNRPDKDLISIGADLIVGFPGETDEDAQSTLDGVDKFKINKLHVFPFSAHKKYETVIASKFPNQIDLKIIKPREHTLIQLGDKIGKEFEKKNLGVVHKVLIEEKKLDFYLGWTPNYLQAKILGKNLKKGDLVDYQYTNE